MEQLKGCRSVGTGAAGAAARSAGLSARRRRTHPSAAAAQSTVWVRYIELEMSPTRVPDEVKPLFSRCLLNCPTVELHQLYLR